MAPLGDNMRGALWMAVAMAGLALNDALMKSVSEEIPAFQAIFVRGLVGTLAIGIFAFASGAIVHLPHGRDRLMFGYRAIFEVATTSFFLIALYNMPLANVTAIMQAVPLMVTLAAAWLLGHSIGWRRYIAIGLGFLGVMLIIRPGGAGFNSYSFLGLAAALSLTFRDIATRVVSATLPTPQITLISFLAITLFAGFVTLLSDWEPMRWEVTARLAIAGLLFLIGINAGIIGMRTGDVGVVSPFRYTQLVWALILGLVIFGAVPDWLT
ncbi:MAG TPA: DMT family transporter, partial [Paracoccaceae bacterium]|nr:DMT family transporter [Paracoccaceae bacterium]